MYYQHFNDKINFYKNNHIDKCYLFILHFIILLSLIIFQIFFFF